MKKQELIELGVPDGEAIGMAFVASAMAAGSGLDKFQIKNKIRELTSDPSAMLNDRVFGELAKYLVEASLAEANKEPPKPSAPWANFGVDIDKNAEEQMRNACGIPVAVAGALMPDAHLGYSMPIGGVIAVKNAVVPSYVGYDIACRMRLTVVDLPIKRIKGDEGKLKKAIEECTRFGVGSEFENPKEHPVMDEDWTFSQIVNNNKPKAWRQLGSSGSGNHFVEFGTITFDKENLGLKAGVYTAILSHSGSRGTGGNIAQHYIDLASDLHQELPKEMRGLAWLDMDSQEGQEYWRAMELMGRYAAACHELIHKGLVKDLKLDVLLEVENHHNFAWKETHNGQEVYVHRKGATPAGVGVLGVIPGSMATPGYLVKGKGNPLSLMSASHGAGRKMSRKQTKQITTTNSLNRVLEAAGVTLISAGLDESPSGYKDIESVMAAQKDLVEVIAKFEPKLVKMAPPGGRSED